MPLDDLTSVIETLQQRIRQHGQTLRANETRTRLALIDPLLCALGWDTADPAVVEPEYRVDVGWADYALQRPGTQPIAVIEAKRLGSVVDNHLGQAVNYCIHEGIPYAGVTDGNHWQLYRTFEEARLADKLVLDVRIDDASVFQSALKLLLLWRPNLASGRPTEASEPILAPPQSAPQPQPPQPPARVAPMPTQVPLGQTQSEWVPLSSFSWSKDANPPSLMRFPDGSEHQAQRWRDLVKETATWLWSKGWLTPANLPVPVPRSSRYVANTEPVHQNGQPFTDPQKIEGTPVIVECNAGGAGLISYARTLLQHCGVNPADVFVQTAP